MTSPNVVQETNIEKIIEDSTPKELELLSEKRRILIEQLKAVDERVTKLLNIALAAGHDFSDYATRARL